MPGYFDTYALGLSRCAKIVGYGAWHFVHGKFWLTAMTAAKKILIHWKPPHDLSTNHWLHSLLETLYFCMLSQKKKKKKIGLKTCKTYKIQELVYKDWPKHLLKIK